MPSTLVVPTTSWCMNWKQKHLWQTLELTTFFMCGVVHVQMSFKIVGPLNGIISIQIKNRWTNEWTNDWMRMDPTTIRSTRKRVPLSSLSFRLKRNTLKLWNTCILGKFTNWPHHKSSPIGGVTFILLISWSSCILQTFLGLRQRHELTSVSTQYIGHGDLGRV